MLTAGLTSGLPTNILPQALPGQTLGFADMLQANIVRNAIGASVGTAIQGGDFGANISDALINAAIQTVGAQAAIQIGAAAKAGRINVAVQLAAHAALGCAIGAASSGGGDGGRGCVGGAVGGVVGTLMSKAYIASQRGEKYAITLEEVIALKESGVNFGKFSGALAAFAVGADVNAAGDTADNAARHNVLDTVWDVLSLIYDVGKIGYGYYKDDNGVIKEGFIDLAADGAATLIPFVPAGGTKLARAATEEGYTILYRTVSKAELDDIVKYGGFRSGRGSLNAKWFAESAEDASAWAKKFYKWDRDPKYTVRIEVPNSVAARMRRESNLDGIGPARSAGPNLLPDINRTGRIGILDHNRLGRR